MHEKEKWRHLLLPTACNILTYLQLPSYTVARGIPRPLSKITSNIFSSANFLRNATADSKPPAYTSNTTSQLILCVFASTKSGTVYYLAL